MSNDPVLLELAQTPLMLEIVSVACAGLSKEALITNEADSPKTRQQHIFHRYVEQMFERKESATSLFQKAQIVGWLSLLARKMKKRSQAIFMVEEVQPSWLNSKGQWLAYQGVIALWVALLSLLAGWMPNLIWGEQPDTLIAGLVWILPLGLSVFFGCRSMSRMESGILCALLGTFFTGVIGWIFFNGATSAEGFRVLPLALLNGMVCGVFGGLGIGSVYEINHVETICWRWWVFVKKTVLGTMVGYLVVGPLFLFIILVFGILLSLISVTTAGAWPSGGMSWDLIGAIFFILLFLGPFFAFVFGLNSASINAVRAHRATPNQGVWLSLKNALATLLLFITAWMACWLLPFLVLSAYGLPSRPNGESDTVGLLLAILPLGLLIGLIVFLNFGGSAVLKHYALRLILWCTGSMPLQFIPFLDHCAKLILLRKVGGGYVFIHRTLLEHFAELPLENSRTGNWEK